MQTRTAPHRRPETAHRQRILSPVLDEIPVTEQRLEPAGIPTSVLAGGHGAPVVLLHGAGEFAATWARVIPDLTRTHRVIAPDLPGHGASGLDGPLDRRHVLQWLRELIDLTCDEPPILMGHLLGGAVAARFAAAEPRRVRHLVLVDSLGLAWYRPAPGFAFAMLAFIARPSERTQERLFRRCMADLDRLHMEMDGHMELLEAYALERAREPTLKVALRHLMPAFGVPPIAAADLRRISTPTTLVWGRDDLQAPLRVAERASTRYGWSLHVIDDARDDPAIEQPRAFLEALHPVLGGTGAVPAAQEHKAAWDRIAADFDRATTPFALRLGEEVIERAGVRHGERFLDVAAGSGALSIPAARRGARVLATDVSPRMIELLLTRARAEGLAGVEARPMDGHALRLEDGTFDVVASQNGVTVFPDMARGLEEMVRVTRPGGRVVVVGFGPMREAEFLACFMAAMRAVVPGFAGLPTDPPPLPFQAADPATLRRRLEDAGLSDIRVEPVTWEMAFESGRHLWDTVTASNPIATRLVADLSEAGREEVIYILDGLLRERSGGAGGVLCNSVNIGIGTRAWPRLRTPSGLRR
jgi:pimeloyl-ACP methyl ester carboxylesterase/ubiquinone/menaquinone biosynthesis C-methylase UbiE